MRQLLATGLLVLSLVGAAVLAPPSSATLTHEDTTAPAARGTVDNFDTTEVHITVYDNGTAKWTFAYQRTLANASEKQQFRQFADTFNNNSTQLYTSFRSRAAALTSAGQQATGREMQATAFSRRAHIGGLVNNNRGIVTMSFHWTNFTTTSGGQHVIGDVFQGGLYLGPNQSLVIHHGPNLTVDAVTPRDTATLSGDTLSTSDSVSWTGKQDFTDQRPRVVFAPAPAPTTPTTDTTADTTTHTSPTDDRSPLWFPVLAALAVVVLGAAYVWGHRKRTVRNDTATAEPAPDSEAADEATGSNGPILTDEERVLQLLRENGGRMKQSEIVEATDWSKSKVSMLLSDMEDEGDITKLQLGRENVISLDGHEPDAAGSPFDDE